MHFFPIPYKDELLYSILARYCIQSGNIRSIHNIDDFFGNRNIVASVGLPTKIDALVANMPKDSQYTAENLICNHTLFPFYAPFVQKDRSESAFYSMKSGEGSIPLNKFGITASSISDNKYFRFCPKCLQENREMFGETYWDRIHQIPCVFVCTKHQLPLHNSKALIRGSYRQCFIPATLDNCICDETINYSHATLDELLGIAEDVESIIKSPSQTRLSSNHRQLYMSRLIELGYANLNTMVHQKRLIGDLVEFYGEEVLSLLQCSISINQEVFWISRLLRDSSYITSPVKHIVMARFLGISIAELLTNAEKNEKSNQLQSNIYKNLWEAELIKLAEEKLSLRKIAQIMDSTPRTVKKHLENIGVEPFWRYNGGGKHTIRDYKDSDEFKIRIKENRKVWLKVIVQNPELSKNKLRSTNETIYTWLYKYDQEWLKQNSPSTKMPHKAVNWNVRDEKLLPRVKTVIKDMRSGKPEWVSWTTVGNKLEMGGTLGKNKDKLLKVNDYMQSSIESLDDYQARKILWAIKELKNEGVTITKWKILEKAGVKSRYLLLISDKVISLLKDGGYYEELQNIFEQ